MSQRMYKTLPSALSSSSSSLPHNRHSGRGDHGNHGGRGGSRSSKESPQLGNNNLFGGLHLSNLISGGMNLLGQLRRKANSSSNVASADSATTHFSSNSSTSTSSSPTSTSSSSEKAQQPPQEIEMSSFNFFPAIPEPSGDDQAGLGHSFAAVGSFNPAWCDLCGNLVWGLYDTGAARCANCSYTCHVKCQKKVRLNCSALTAKSEQDFEEEDDLSTLADISTMKSEIIEDDDDEFQDALQTLKDVEHIQIEHDGAEELQEANALTDDDDVVTQPPSSLHHLPISTVFGDDLPFLVATYNRRCPPGQETVLDDAANSVRGFVRVELSLSRPVTVTSSDDLAIEASQKSGETCKTLTCFYLPAGTVRAVHVDGDTTAKHVIQTLLDKFRVADSPHKYALYEKKGAKPQAEEYHNGSIKNKTLSRMRLRRLHDDERPLALALSWCVANAGVPDRSFVLQENDPGEVCWDSFSLPELRNFLRILDREEAWYKRRIHQKYEEAVAVMERLVREKRQKVEHQQEQSSRL